MKKLLFLDVDDTFLTPPYEAVARTTAFLGVKNFPTEAEFLDRGHIDFHLAFPEVFRTKNRMWFYALASLPFGFFRSHNLYPELDRISLKSLLDDRRVIVLTKNPPSFKRWRVKRIEELTGASVGERYIACGPIVKKSTPKIEVIKQMAAKHGIALHDCLLVDDSAENIRQAAEVGVHGLMIDAPWNQADREALKSAHPSRVETVARSEFIQKAKSWLGADQKNLMTYYILPSNTAALAKQVLRQHAGIPGESNRPVLIPLENKSFWNFLKVAPNNPVIDAFKNLLKRSDLVELDVRLSDGKGNTRVLTAPEKQRHQIRSPDLESASVIQFRKFCRNFFESKGYKFQLPAFFNFYFRPRTEIVREILEDSKVKAAIIEHVKTEKVSMLDAEELAKKHINSMIFNRTYRACANFYYALNIAFGKIFRSINAVPPEEIRKLEDEHFTVYAPIHRSYLDSGILYCVLARHSQHFPFIVAADKMLDNWLGRMGSRVGSFFIQRKNVDGIYSAILASHLRQIHRDGATLEVFIEGMRSRSGLTLPPKKGIINAVDANRALIPDRKVAIVPVAFAYNKLPESEVLLSEVYEDRRKDGKVSLREQADILVRRRRRKKTFLQKMKAMKRRLTAQAISDCHIEFGDAVILGDEKQITHAKPDLNIAPQIQDYLNEVMFRINRNTPILPSSMMCLALLAAEDHHATSEDVKSFMLLSQRLISLYGLPSHLLFDPQDIDAHMEASRKLPMINRKFKRAGIDERWILCLSDLDFTRALHYRNNILHYFVLPAILANILFYSKTVKTEELHRFLDHLFSDLSVKYFLPPIKDSANFITEILNIFCEAGFVHFNQDIYTVKAEVANQVPFTLLSKLADDFANTDLVFAFSRFRRAFQRVELDIAATVQVADHRYPVTIRNLSVGGALLSCDRTLVVDQILQLEIPHDRQLYVFEGVVSRAEEYAMGVRFIENSQNTQVLIQMLLQNKLKKAA